MSTYCIGDVHGCLRTLLALFAKIDYRPEKDRLWFTGDLVDRGPDSVGVLRLLSGLPETVAVMGNHDFHLLACYFGGIQNCKPGYQKILATPGLEQFIPWLLSRPFIHYDNNYPWVLTHAGIYPKWTIKQALKYAKELEQLLQNNHHEKLADFFRAAYGNESVTWQEHLTDAQRYQFLINSFTRMRYCKSDGTLEFDNVAHPDQVTVTHPDLKPWFDFPGRQIDATLGILFGHWAALGNSIRRERMICLDSGCSWGSQLTAYCLETGQFYQVDYQDG